MSDFNTKVRSARVLLIGLFTVIVVIGLALVILLIAHPGGATTPQQTNVDPLANSTDACVTCHRNSSPGIVKQFSLSSMARSNVSCRSCHEVNASYPGAILHEGSYILASPTSARCQQCHQVEVAQYNQSRHGLPAYVAVFGTSGLTQAQMAQFQSIPEGGYAPDKARNAIAAIEGPLITPFACETCHNIGRPAVDGSVGQCQKCHFRHEFSLEQVRKPETCNACHIGPDHPQWEIYHESPHGIAYSTDGANWNWDAITGTLTVKDFPAPTCAICHMSGFGKEGTTHDVGDRLTWYSFASISERRPAWQDNKVRMQSVCLECHNQDFVNSLYDNGDKAVGRVNDWVKQSNDIMAQLQAKNLVTAEPFDQPIDYVYFEIWHHWGRTAKFGTWMQGPDYTQWHGAYEIIKGLAELNDLSNQLQKSAETPK